MKACDKKAIGVVEHPSQWKPTRSCHCEERAQFASDPARSAAISRSHRRHYPTLRVLTLILALALALAMAAGLALAADDPEPARQVLAGGASNSTAPGITLRATLGQPIVGLVSSDDVTLGQGFWGLGARYHTYLPLLFRNHHQT